MQIYVAQNNFETWCHTVTEPNMAQSAACFLPINRSLLSLPQSPTPIPLQNIVSYSSTYQKLTKFSYLG